MAHIILFQDRNFNGNHRHIFVDEPNLRRVNTSWLHDELSSFVVLEGTWMFFRDKDFGVPAWGPFGPGLYPWVEDFGIPNDSVSSLKPV